MGILRIGGYTYGNDSYANIIALTGMSVGDTVFDTDHHQKRIYDGDNWVHGNQITQETTGGLLDGAWMIQSASADDKVHFQGGSADTEGIIGIVEDEKTQSVGDMVAVSYAGDIKKCLITAGAAGDNAEPADFVEINTASAGYGDIQSAGVGTSAIYLDAVATATGERRVLLRGCEKN